MVLLGTTALLMNRLFMSLCFVQYIYTLDWPKSANQVCVKALPE